MRVVINTDLANHLRLAASSEILVYPPQPTGLWPNQKTRPVINLTQKKRRSSASWPCGRAGPGCGELETSPGAAGLGQGLTPRQVKQGLGPWAGWAEAPGKLSRDREGLSAPKGLTGLIRGVVQSKAQHRSCFTPCPTRRLSASSHSKNNSY